MIEWGELTEIPVAVSEITNHVEWRYAVDDDPCLLIATPGLRVGNVGLHLMALAVRTNARHEQHAESSEHEELLDQLYALSSAGKPFATTPIMIEARTREYVVWAEPWER